MKIIEIGDLHVKKDNIDESIRFIKWLIDIIKEVKSKENGIKLIFLGDQFNDFGVARVEVIKFWTWASNQLTTILPPTDIVYLIGNHDRNSEGTDSAMSAFFDKGQLIDKLGEKITHNIGGIGFIRDNELFTKEVITMYNEGVRLIYCHQEFQGAMFETGMYVPHGVDPTIFPPNLIFRSGHFHKKQSFGKITYVGTPRYLTKSDIGETKGIHIYDSITLKETFLPTPEEVCESLKLIKINEGEDLPKVNFTNKVYVELCGSKQWCEKFEKKVPTGTKLSCVYTDTIKDVKVKESDGIPLSFAKFYQTQNIPENIKNEVLKRIYETCQQLRG